jgi:hypothetical protein
LEKAFGPGIEAITRVAEPEVWGLVITHSGGRRTLGFDEAHRRIAGVLGWDALPSPADRVEWTEAGLRLQGAGQGHRVGLCLAE